MSDISPSQIPHILQSSIVPRTRQDSLRLILLGVLAGAYIALGGLLATIVGGGMPGIGTDNPGLQKLVFGGVFPVGLMLVVLAGGELVTGNMASFIPALRAGSIGMSDILRNWALAYLGNFVGAFGVAALLAWQTGLLDAEPWRTFIQGVAQTKTSQGFWPLLLKGIGCNWLVCLAIWMALTTGSTGHKVVAIWMPIMAFVALGFEHCVANMFFIPAGILLGADASWTAFALGNLVPVTIGNIIGGGALVGWLYAFIYCPDTNS